MISVELIGINQFKRYFNTLGKTVPHHMKIASEEVLIRIRDTAIQNVQSDMKWGDSTTEPRITDTSTWDIIDTGGGGLYSSKQLICNTPHAHIVEYGAIGGMVTRRPGEGPPFNIGGSQGIPIGPRYSFRLQEGKHFLQRAVDQITGTEMEEIAYKHLTDAIRSA